MNSDLHLSMMLIRFPRWAKNGTVSNL